MSHQNNNQDHQHDDDGADEPSTVIVPLPRQAPDDHIEHLPTTTAGPPVWSYDQKRPRSGDRRWTGHISHVSGTESGRLRGEIADVIADLLRWATTHQQHPTNKPDNPDDEGLSGEQN